MQLQFRGFDDLEMSYFSNLLSRYGIVDVFSNTLLKAYLKKSGLFNTEIRFIGRGYLDNNVQYVLQTFINIEGKQLYGVDLYYKKDTGQSYFNKTFLLFDKVPSKDSMDVANQLPDFILKITRMRRVFDCWECGGKTHWTQINGSFDKILTCVSGRYCGC